MLWIENDLRTIPVEHRPSWASCLLLFDQNDIFFFIVRQDNIIIVSYLECCCFYLCRRSSSREDEARIPLLDNGHDIIQINDITDSVENHEENPHPKNINVRAAFIHVVGDIIQSIGVLISSLIIKFKVN